MSKPIRANIRGRASFLKPRDKRVDRATYSRMAPTVQRLTNELLKVQTSNVPPYDPKNVRTNVMDREQLLQLVKNKDKAGIILSVDW